MDWEDQILKACLRRVTPQEETLFSGQKGKELAQFIRHVDTTPHLTEANVDYFNQLIEDFSRVSQVKTHRQDSELCSEGGIIMKKSFLYREGRGLSWENHRGKHFLAFNHFSSVVSGEGIFAAIRPYPVKWYDDHISGRFLERHKETNIAQDPIFFQHNAVALAMLRIIEDEHDHSQTGYHPFLLPERNGVLIGHTLRAMPDESWNRIMFLASNDYSAMPMDEYEWFPRLNMTVRTFYGPDEMTPAMVKMRQFLLPFYSGEKAKGLSLEMDAFHYVNNGTAFERDSRSSQYMDALIELADLMKTPLWRQAAILPEHLRKNRPSSPRL